MYAPPHTHKEEFTTEKRNLVPKLLQKNAECPSCTLPPCSYSSSQEGTCDQTVDLTSVNDEVESREDEMQHVEREEEKKAAFFSSGPVAFSSSSVHNGIHHSFEGGEALDKSSAIIPSSSQQPK